MGTTPKGIRYPESTAAVRDGAAAMQTLATDVDSRFLVIESTTGSQFAKARVICRTIAVTTNQFGQGNVPYGGTPLSKIYYLGVTIVNTTAPTTTDLRVFTLYSWGTGTEPAGPTATFVCRQQQGSLVVNTAMNVAVLLIGVE